MWEHIADTIVRQRRRRGAAPARRRPRPELFRDPDRVIEARRNTLVTAGVIALFLAFVALLAATGWLTFSYASVAALLTIDLLLNLGLAATAPHWAHAPSMPWVFGTQKALLLTAILHYLGGPEFGLFLIAYGFVVLHMEVFRSAAAAFFIANLSAASTGLLAWLEASGWIPRQPGVVSDDLEASQLFAYVCFAFLALNVLSLFAYRYGRQLRRLTHRLQHKVAEQTVDLRQANRELAEVNRNLAEQATALEKHQQELERFAFIVSHDLKNPISAILLTADLAVEHNPDVSGELRASLERIARLAERTEEMIRDLLGLFRAISLREGAAWIDTNDLVGHALESLQPQIQAKGVTVDVGVLPALFGMPRQLSHAVVNLLSNAVKYVPAGSGEVHVSGELSNGHVLLSVRDNGIGIPQPYQQAVFGLFRRVPPNEQLVDGEPVSGTGVGLAIVKRIAEAHGGCVELESAPDRGSDFRLRLPAHRGVARAA